MDFKSKIKRKTVLFTTASRKRPKSKKIFNQPTLVATMLSLKDGQKAVIAASRVNENSNGEIIIPFCFKVRKEIIPTNIRPYKLSPKNTIKIQLADVKPIDAMILAVGEDSKDIDNLYRKFLDKTKTLKAKKKITIWLPSEEIIFSRTFSNCLPPVSNNDFETFIFRAGHRFSRPRNIITTPTHSKNDIVTIDSEDELGPIFSRQEGELEKDKSSNFVNFKQSLIELKDMVNFSVTNSNIKLFHVKITQVFDTLSNLLESRQESKSGISTRPVATSTPSTAASCSYQHKTKTVGRVDDYFITADDKTYNHDIYTYIEGSLPVLTTKYKMAMKSLPKKVEELEPTLVITAIVKFTFPSTWIVGVTLRGAGHRTSLVSDIWNYQNPYTCEGVFRNGLGVSRLRALLDHSMRKCNKVSYDLSSEKALHTSIAKAMHYVRTQIAVKEASGKDLDDDSEKDINTDYHESDYNCDDESLLDSLEERYPQATRKSPRFQESNVINELDNFTTDSDSVSSTPRKTQKTKGNKSPEPKIICAYMYYNQSEDVIDADPIQTVTPQVQVPSDQGSSSNVAADDFDSGLEASINNESIPEKPSASNKRPILPAGEWNQIAQKRLKSSLEAIKAVSTPRALQEPTVFLNRICGNEIGGGDAEMVSVDLSSDKRSALGSNETNEEYEDAIGGLDQLTHEDHEEDEENEEDGENEDEEDDAKSVADDHVDEASNKQAVNKPVEIDLMDFDDSTDDPKSPKTDEESQRKEIPLTQALAAINDDSSSNTASAKFVIKLNDREVDLEDLFVNNPRAALSYMQQNNISIAAFLASKTSRK